ncbi:LPP20 family lipoprotein [Salinispirillum marinum]|uniref:LPP20 family lipoprotein n=2 Tax=Saccharospirillaceae TaxID=255527 RepID=A0ABV8BEW4_9GAMM
MKTVLTLGLLSMLVAGLLGCASTPDDVANARPDWVTMPPRTADVIYGMGGVRLSSNEADSLQQARNAATIDLLQNLQVQISANTASTITANDNTIASTYQQSIQSVVPDINIEDTRLVDTWRSPEGIVYALVSLNTLEAARRQSRLFEDDRRALQAVEIDISAPQWLQLQGWHSIMAAVGSMEARNQLHQFLVGRVIDVGWANRRAEIIQAHQQFMAQLPLGLDAENTLAAEQASAIRAVFANQGLGFTDAAQAVWRLSVNMSEEAQTQGAMHYSFVTTAMRLTDEQNVVRWQASATRRGVAGSADRALQQAVTATLDHLNTAFIDALEP